MTFPTYRLPEEIERGATGGPEFKNIIQTATSGQELRVRQWQKCRAKYDIGYGLLDSDNPLGNYRVILHTFYGHLGKLHPFRFKAWNDFTATDERFGTGNGSETNFQLTNTYDPSMILLAVAGPHQYVRNIVLPQSTGLVIEVAGTPTSAYTLLDGGIIDFDTAPTSGQALTWTGTFDLPMRFDTDYLPIVMNEADLAQINSIPIIEVINEF